MVLCELAALLPTMELAKAMAETLASGMTAIGIGVAGWWTWRLFVRQRTGYPKATLSHSVHSVRLASDRLVVRVSTCIENTGAALIAIERLQTRLHRVQPLTPAEVERVATCQDREATWPLLGDRRDEWGQDHVEIEPGESERIICDFVIQGPVSVVEVYSHLPNMTKTGRDIGWHATTLAVPMPIGEAPNADV